jgi:hypothetical protein
MLSIGKLGAGQHSYYLDKIAEGAEDYYSHLLTTTFDLYNVYIIFIG